MMFYPPLLVLLLLQGVVSGSGGRWDNHKRRGRRPTAPPPPPTLPATRRPQQPWSHGFSASPPPHRCQISAVSPLPEGGPVNQDYVTGVSSLLLEDKLLLAPIVFEGAMVSRTNTYKGLYFVSFKVLKVVKGRLHPQLQGHVRLLFQTEQLPPSRGGGRPELRGNACPPVPFNVRSGRKYLIFVKKLSVGRYVAMAEPEVVRKKTRKALLRTFCPGCGE